MDRMVPHCGAASPQQVVTARWPVHFALAAGLSLLAACSTTSLDEPGQAPVSDRSIGSAGKAVTATAALPGQENAGKPGYYTVRPGDTLTRIGLETGQHPRDLARWNALENPNLIEVGQVLRVVPPVTQPATATTLQQGAVAAPVTAGAPDARVKPRPLSARNGDGSAKPAVQSEQEPAAMATEELSFSWPGSGSVIERFDEARNKGVDIAGKAGDPVLAAADGRVVYAGSGLRGYGNLIILKHNNTYLTAYAHNQALLVKEDQNVRQGQKIAEMGSSDADRVKLHFEVRRQGKPVDPLKFLPSR
jgi:lipoprotein NlpD